MQRQGVLDYNLCDGNEEIDDEDFRQMTILKKPTTTLKTSEEIEHDT